MFQKGRILDQIPNQKMYLEYVDGLVMVGAGRVRGLDRHGQKVRDRQDYRDH